MTLDSDIAENIQLANPGEMITLYILDATILGGGVYRFTNSTEDNQPIIFDGETYSPIDIQSSGWEFTAIDSLPTPHIKITNVNRVMMAAVITYGDLLGATFTRIRTFKKFLDSGTDANPNAILIADIFKIERKVEASKYVIEWELSASIDQEGRELPGRQYLKDACTHIYRIYRGGTFIYTKATCPYSATDYFMQNGTPTTDPSLDKCGKRLSDCRLRFGQNGNLPFRGFPGLGRFQ